MPTAVVERFSENAWLPPWTRHQHFARYEWAATLAQGRSVVDAACGTGYGGRLLLTRGAARLEGFDLSPQAIAEAKARPMPCGHFQVADAIELPCPGEECDLFLSFETIEHVVDDCAFLSEVRRVLKADGVFVCSTPNRTLTNPGLAFHGKPYNPFHLREYSRTEMETLLRQFFPQVTFLGQSFYSTAYVRVLNRLGSVWPKLAVRIHQVRKVLGIPWEKRQLHWPTPLRANAEPEILIAVCGG